LAKAGGRQQSGHLKQRTVGTAKFGFDEARGSDAALTRYLPDAPPRAAEAEAIERDQRGLRIAAIESLLGFLLGFALHFPGLSQAYIECEYRAAEMTRH